MFMLIFQRFCKHLKLFLFIFFLNKQSNVYEKRIENYGPNKAMLFFLIKDKIQKDGKEWIRLLEKNENFVISKVVLKMYPKIKERKFSKALKSLMGI